MWVKKVIHLPVTLLIVLISSSTVGTYCEQGSSVEVDCLAGTYNSISKQSVCLDCPEGYYCPAGSSTITDCPMGKIFCQEK